MRARKFLALIPRPLGFSDEATAVTYDLVLEGLVQNLLRDSRFLHLHFVPFGVHTMPPQKVPIVSCLRPFVAGRP